MKSQEAPDFFSKSLKRAKSSKVVSNVKSYLYATLGKVMQQ